MSKLLGIDWGEKKTGLAISDELQMLAKPLQTMDSFNLSTLEKIIEEENIEKIIVGRPRNMDGSLGPQAKKVSFFVSKLEKKIKLPIIYEDETNTTNIVKSMLIKEGLDPRKNKDLIDKKSAQLILQGYIDENIK
ncbi:Holliday junction resolvase RuvX [bacterium CG_4_10_14_0_2_um_filter_33_32]|nr:MAG: hypothetical protein AUJ93_02815 [bacterium CG2_30_33_46]PIR68053.1 MAG: Holliday junction resolvase RuvX [bacterium CG10_big_fil_rev_8_21_14_0_10_33_18]PIU76726.1 MAG: Holliday junction resolvase RuvX [bacterium CG06_land_8_20_14_3_00_33_50]PIW80820.1 MAG: Holliday junction resolvase RuvX [bacterium CG_4_8_14_3_um_filter_33_28]PIY85155.1 MAG: Holliday junction resolvase RuvX [bacterium CG_4_10_14_0_8_um_filter_33_57]PIZ85360.1 MAG: Holliday junction resolvase RuvX [bacterium CG_4_10_1